MPGSCSMTTPAKRGVPNPGRRCREQRPFNSWEQIRSLAERLGPMFGPMIVFAAATGLRPSELFALEQGDVDRAAAVVQVRRAYANGRVKQTRTRLSGRAVPLQAIALPRRSTSYSRGKTARCCSRTHAAATSTSATSTVATGSRSRRRSESSRCAISTTYATPTPASPFAPACRCSPSHGSWGEPRDDRPPLRPPRSRQLPARRLAPRRARSRTGRGRSVDTGHRPTRPHSDTVSRPLGRRSRRVVDARWTPKPEAVTSRTERSA